MEISRRTWTAAVKLAVIVSVLAAGVAFGVSHLGEVPQAAVVVPVIFVAFAASWVQTDRIRRQAQSDVSIRTSRAPATVTIV
ncbi:hypothetical protein [Ilumatobacter nonamiensis]|uniref:hypothetical protein n=1 Tax=Ilumatobacter nonamiensis TaxID=467093 RepID=UPI00034DEA47|nr:hypothetical protein [Ilumatobacter nonamiensis]